MNRTALIYHEDYLKHNAGLGHPECPERLSACMEYFQETGRLDKVVLVEPEPLDKRDLFLVHSREHVDFVENFCASGGGFLDPDTYVGRDSYYIARLAAGGVWEASRQVMDGNVDNAFALVRPPGHHAHRSKAAGFCIFNNVAVSIRKLQREYGLNKIFLLDWDGHASNGTTSIFYEDNSVLNLSIHQDPRTAYPGTGFVNQIGSGAGLGYTVNVLLEPGSGNPDYVYVFNELVRSLVDSYKPELIVVSAGQDSHRDDPLMQLDLTDEGYAWMTNELVNMADKHCNGKMVVELEGGYNLDALKKTNQAIIEALLGEGKTREINGEASASTRDIVERVRSLIKAYHRI